MGKKTSSSEPAILPSAITLQIDQFVDNLRRFNQKRLNPRNEKDYEFLKQYFKDFVKDQNIRAKEISSEEYKAIHLFASSQFPVKTMFNLCIDGRVLAILIFGASAIVGSSVRVPGGIIRDFIRDQDGKLRLKKDSEYGKLLEQAFDKYQTSCIAEVLDSHVGCAARLAEEMSKGRKPQDSGLLSDVSHKKQIAEGMISFSKELRGKNHIIPIQTSFDPSAGYLYMGLETDAAMTFARKHGGFTKDVLATLVADKKIIATHKLAMNPDIEKSLIRYFFPLDWKENYRASADAFWHAVANLRPLLFPVIEKVLLGVYPYLSEKEYSQEKEERMLLLTANLFSGFLHNHAEDVVKNAPGDHLHVSHYPYGIHQEGGVKVSEGGYPPYHMSSFAVFIRDEKNLTSNVGLSADLIRKNREAKRVQDVYGFYNSLQEFVEAPVPVVVQEVVRDVLSEKDWEFASRISWDDMPETWETMSDMEFLFYLHGKGNMPSGLLIGLTNLRRRMAILYDATNPTSSHLIEHYKVALPVIANRYRENEFVVPFVKLGFS